MNRVPDRIVIIGFMGAGKSRFGSVLAKRLGFRHIDTDREIEKAEQRSIPKIFEESGEAGFRKAESRALSEALKASQVVVSAGGGAVTVPGNCALLKDTSFVIWLRASLEAVLERTQGSPSRPLLNVEDPRGTVLRLMKEREPLYAACANAQIQNDGGELGDRAEELIHQQGWTEE